MVLTRMQRARAQQVEQAEQRNANERRSPPVSPLSSRPVPLGSVVNPLTNRVIKVGSATYRSLVDRGVLDPQRVSLHEAQGMARPSAKPCPPGQVRNPQTGRCINVSKGTYQRLLQQGVQFHDDDLPNLVIKAGDAVAAPQLPPRSPRPTQRETAEKCRNSVTLYQSDVTDLPEGDLLMLPSGFCYSIDELVDWIQSESFNNKDAYDSERTLFDHSNEHVWSGVPRLAQVVSEYFRVQRQKRDAETALLANNLPAIYAIGKAARICMFDSYLSHEKEDSSTFEYSVEALSDLATTIRGLPKEARAALYNPHSKKLVEDIIEDANTGARCIHGIGYVLLQTFVSCFQRVEITGHLKYNPMGTGLYFVLKDGQLLVYNYECRLINAPHTQRYTNAWTKEKLGFNQVTDLVWTYSDMLRHHKREYAKCPNEASYSTLGSHDEWGELMFWRKVTLSSGHCFDLLFLLRTMTDQLNTCINTNPSPKYPTNPFTRMPLSHADLVTIRRRITINYIKVSEPLMLFLSNPELLWSQDREYVQSRAWTEKCTDVFGKELRYLKAVDSIESGVARIAGLWVPVSMNPTGLERQAKDYLESNDLSVITRFLTIVPGYYFSDNYFKNGNAGNIIHGYGDADFQDLQTRS